METEGTGPAPGDVRAQVVRIISSPTFEASERNRRFLTYVVEETLAGNASRIKAYSVATVVFGRDGSFDPQLDPIVRIEASRLRRALEHYYLVAGMDDPVRIEILKGSYVPSFANARRPDPPPLHAPVDHEQPVTSPGTARRGRPRWPYFGAIAGCVAIIAVIAMVAAERSDISQAAQTAGVARSAPSIFVAAFDEEGDHASFPTFGLGLRREIAARLTRFNDLIVFGTDPTGADTSDADLMRTAAGRGARIDYVLSGSVVRSPGAFKIEALLRETATGRFLWSGDFEGALAVDDILRARDAIADRIAQALAQPYGVIFQEEARALEGQSAGTLSAYSCVVQFYIYWDTHAPDEYGPVKDCLERTVARQPTYAEAFAALSLVYIDAHRLRHGDGPQDGRALDAAFAHARRALKLAPGSTRGHQALSLAHWLANDVESSLAVARDGLRLNPNDTELMAELGLRLVFTDGWEDGLPLLEAVAARSLSQPGTFRIGLSLHHYRQARYRDALEEARQVALPRQIYGHMLVAMAAGQLGLEAEAAAAVERIEAIDPAFAPTAVAYLQARNIHPEIIAMVIDGLQNAGMDVAAMLR